MNCDSIIRTLEDHPSRLNKEGIIRAEAESNNVELFEGFQYTFDPMVTFGVKKVPTHGGGEGQGLPWTAFKELLNSLAKREITGHAARDAIELALSASTKSQWNDWYRRILMKDLKCGISEVTINKVLKEFPNIKQIQLFECMLAHDGAKQEKRLVGKKLLEPKLDGVRVVTVINVVSRTATMYSRNGKLLENFSHITDSIEANIGMFDRSIIIDGEMVSSSFQALMKQVHRKSDVQSSDARLMAFDVLPLSEFLAGESIMGQRRRSNLLRSMQPQFDPAATYECKRSVSWLKMKPFIEVSLTVVAVEEGSAETKNVGKLGALVCEGEDDGKFIRVNVGGGYTDELRDSIWASKDTVIGQIVEVRADAATRSQDSEDVYSLRFPRFLRFRGFAKGEKI